MNCSNIVRATLVRNPLMCCDDGITHHDGTVKNKITLLPRGMHRLPANEEWEENTFLTEKLRKGKNASHYSLSATIQP